MGVVRVVGYNFTQFMWNNQGSEDGDTVELVLSDAGHKRRTNRSGTVEVH